MFSLSQTPIPLDLKLLLGGKEEEEVFKLLPAMDQFDESFKNQKGGPLQVLKVTRYVKESDTLSEIEEGLFLGSIGAAKNKTALKSLNVTHVLTVASSLPPAHPNDFLYKVINVIDRKDTDMKQYFTECFDFIDEAKRLGSGVLVHCVAGKSRRLILPSPSSVTIVVAYLMKKHGMSLLKALEHVKSRRSKAAPNSGFVSQLREFEKSLQGVLFVLYKNLDLFAYLN
ncbi:dual specificity protein phosphatase 1-like isoform X4 [Carya illinoinensis]|uniref:dual specificity protein phosphatase 1-like isoform X4 n=1 Tax=Carya illinoinensis TaxID=32201 RepID=UPI001C71975B|nr:dual specificity protein phosphatase 1-like isoform X4 [Carya illinoinensis]